MSKHTIIPIFIPHKGCENQCVFCNQNKITARVLPPSVSHTRKIIEEHLSYFNNSCKDREIAFFGGSFTGLPKKEQEEYLALAKEYKDMNKVGSIRLSTRPDYINEDILNNLKKYTVDIIELGIQSFFDDVLIASNRGHTKNDSIKACNLVNEYGFKLGIQLMIGLPGDTPKKSIESSRIATTFKPTYGRLYPTLVLDDTKLYHMYKAKEFIPLSEVEMVYTCKEMYKILTLSKINILRVGLKSTDNITKEADHSKGYHPAFRQLVEGEIAKEVLEKKLNELLTWDENPQITFSSNGKSFNNLIGHKGVNKKYFSNKYTCVKISYVINEDLEDGTYEVTKERKLL